MWKHSVDELLLSKHHSNSLWAYGNSLHKTNRTQTNKQKTQLLSNRKFANQHRLIPKWLFQAEKEHTHLYKILENEKIFYKNRNVYVWAYLKMDFKEMWEIIGVMDTYITLK